MKDILDKASRKRILRAIDFCEGEGIEIFSFTDLETPGDFSVDFSLKSIDDDYWHLIVAFDYFDFVKEETDIFFYIIKEKLFTQVEKFEIESKE